jgi:Zn-dependent peptidase ImmA (M78 family)
LSEKYISKKTREILRKHKNTDLKGLAESLNIYVFECDLGDMCGFYYYIKKCKIILINACLSESHKKIVLAHEIGHAIFHTKLNCAFYRKYTYFSRERIEDEANYCAALIIKSLNIMDDENFNVYSSEMTLKDNGFIKFNMVLQQVLEGV